jgi:hypothetical protein
MLYVGKKAGHRSVWPEYMYMCRQRRDVLEAGVEVKSGGNHDFPRKDSLESRDR